MNPARTLRHFGFRQTIKGSLIIGLLAGLMMVVQGFGYIAAYPDQKSRTTFATSLKSAPALGILYGEPDNLSSPTGYMVYRVGPVMALICSIWGLMTVTKILRGQEEDGRWEILTSARTSRRQTTAQILLGFGESIIVAYLITTLAIVTAGLSPEIDTPLHTNALMALTIFLPSILFVAIGCFTSQLSVSRRRAVTYGLVPLIILFILRSIGNTINDLNWIKNLTPFGWADLLRPITDPTLAWIWPFILFIVPAIGISMYLVAKRDLGSGLIHESDHAKPHYFWLGSANQLTARQHSIVFAGWGVAALVISGMIAAISDVAVRSLTDSPGFKGALAQLGGSVDNLKIAFLGAGMIFVVMLLLIMVAASIGSIRQEESKTYLDNLLTQPKRRSSWLIGRLLLIIVATTVIVASCGLLTWLIADWQSLALDLGKLMLISITLTGTVIFTLGAGTLVYGLLPRLASAIIYIIIVWSFVIDILGAIIKLNPVLVNSSLFHYIASSPAVDPDWTTFSRLVLLGVLMAVAGTIGFAKRDIVSE